MAILKFEGKNKQVEYDDFSNSLTFRWGDNTIYFNSEDKEELKEFFSQID